MDEKGIGGAVSRMPATPQSVSDLCTFDSFSIPASLSHHLARLAPAPKSQRERLENDLQVARNGWTWRKRFARDAREVRKEFW